MNVAASVRTIVCGYCGRPFAEDRGQSACQTCPLADGCRFVRCPSCGYENPFPPRWLGRLRGLFGDREPRR